jgi:hypothetical protein
MNGVNLEIPHIDQNTIECDLRAFTRWLNALADQVNWLSNAYVDLDARVKKNTEDIRKLKIQVNNLEERVNNIDARLTHLEEIVAALDLETLEGLIAMVNGRVDLLYSWLPIPYGMIDPKGWKFAMGTINVTSTTDAPTNVDGPGIYTSGAIEDNDINFK